MQNISSRIDNSTRIVSFSPSHNFYGTRSTSISASDPYGASVFSNTIYFNVTPVNDPPEFSFIPNINLRAETGINNNILALDSYVSDVDNNDTELLLSVVSQSNPQVVDCSVDPQHYLDCTVLPLQSGTSLVTVSASDGEFTAYQNITVDVELSTAAAPAFPFRIPTSCLTAAASASFMAQHSQGLALRQRHNTILL